MSDYIDKFFLIIGAVTVGQYIAKSLIYMYRRVF
jgi:hypothetical protein